MTILLGGRPTPLASVQVDQWGSISAVLTSWDGTSWEVSDYQSGVFLTRGAVVGLGMPPHTSRTTSSASEAGQRYRSHRVEARPGVLPMFVYSDGGSESWLAQDAALWRALQPGRAFSLTVTVPGAAPRTLRLRHIGEDQGYDVDPVASGWAAYVLEVVADSPFWEGEPIVRSWEPQEAEPFFGGNSGAGFGPPFYISSGQTLANAVLDNPGDLEGYAVWLAEGLGAGISSVTVGVAGGITTAPFLIPSGQSLTIDPRPGPQGKSAYDNFGNRRTPELSARSFAPIPAGASVPLSLDMVGEGRVSASLVPRYYRAWG